MRTGIVILGLLIGSLSPICGVCQDKREQGTYREMREYVGELYQQKKYAEAAAVLEKAVDRFPDNVVANTFNLATMRVLTGETGKAIDALEDGLRRGIFYGLWAFNADLWAPLRRHDRFGAFHARNLARLEGLQSKTAIKVEVVTPPGYDPSRTYPLFVALHGGGENLAEFKPNWTAPRLREEFITLYVQSSQLASMTGFHWQDEALTRRDLEAAFKQAVAKYPIDTTRVVVGGFSSGGFASLVTAFHEFLPVRGFVALCPEVPTSITDDDIVKAGKRGLRGTLLTTGQDARLEQQRALAARWNVPGLAGEIIVTPNIGHWYPDDFQQQLDRAIDRILPRYPSTQLR